MPRKEPAKGIHTSPEKAGEKNFEGKSLKQADNPQIMRDILAVANEGKALNKAYKGLWTEEELENSVAQFFEAVARRGLKPTIVALAIWLGLSKSQIWEWENDPIKYTYKSRLIREAKEFMEWYLQSDLDKHTVGSIFLLKCGHGYVEPNKLDITSNGNQLGQDADDVKEMVAKLGLGKPQ